MSHLDPVDEQLDEILESVGILPPDKNSEIYGNHISIVEPALTELKAKLKQLIVEDRKQWQAQLESDKQPLHEMPVEIRELVARNWGYFANMCNAINEYATLKEEKS